MKFYTFFILSIIFVHVSSAQVQNTKEAIVQNKVKSLVEKHCFLGSNASCTVFYKSFDKRGNVTKWDMGRLATRYEQMYDQKDRNIATIWIDKMDSTKIDTIYYSYDKHDTLLSEKFTAAPENDENFQNLYDQKNRLIQSIGKSVSYENDSIISINLFEWTDFDKIKSKESFSYKVGKKQDTRTKYRKIFAYDAQENLIKETHYTDEEITNTIYYTYDAQSRLIEKKEYDTRMIEMGDNKLTDSNNKRYFLTKISYDTKGRIKEKYTHFSDPCMSLDNHFTFIHQYQANDLIESVEVIEEGKPRFTISYEYTFY
jgi:YD repeat-containing protein